MLIAAAMASAPSLIENAIALKERLRTSRLLSGRSTLHPSFGLALHSWQDFRFATKAYH
jgi:hypothetical protein